MRQSLQLRLGMLLLLLASAPAFAATFYVNAAATGTGTGTSWENAFTTIEEAFAVAIVGDEIWVAAGVYKPAASSGYNMPNGVKLYGSFAGTETSIDERNITANLTTLNGDIGVPNVATDNAYSIVVMTNASNLTRLDGFRIINGYSNSSDLEAGGSGLRLSNSSPIIANCIFMINYSKIRGGAVHVRLGGTPQFVNCEFRNNTTGNYTTSNGGAMYINSGTVKIMDCKFVSNSTSGSGGAICALGGNVTLDKCYISGNVATDGAGGIYIGDEASFNVYNTVIVGNSANEAAGAAVYMNTVFNENSHSFINCTIADNKSDVAGATSAFHANNSTTIKNCVFWGNESTYQVYCVPPTIVPNLDYCIIQGTYPDTAATGVFNADPLFVSPGSADQAPFSHETFDYSVEETSPAVNAGTNTALNSTHNKDILGAERIQQGTADAGAFESPFAPVAQSVVVTTLNNVPAQITTIGGTLQLQATVNPAGTSQEVTWSVTSGANFVTVDENGVVTAVANGTAAVRATSVENPAAFGSRQVVVNAVTAGVNNFGKPEFSVYPNPTNGLIEVKSGLNVLQLSVYNIMGQQLYNSKGASINISGAANGVYFLNVLFDGNVTATQKIIKK